MRSQRLPKSCSLPPHSLDSFLLHTLNSSSSSRRMNGIRRHCHLAMAFPCFTASVVCVDQVECAERSSSRGLSSDGIDANQAILHSLTHLFLARGIDRTNYVALPRRLFATHPSLPPYRGYLSPLCHVFRRPSLFITSRPWQNLPHAAPNQAPVYRKLRADAICDDVESSSTHNVGVQIRIHDRRSGHKSRSNDGFVAWTMQT